jgi:hypothetical protein
MTDIDTPTPTAAAERKGRPRSPNRDKFAPKDGTPIGTEHVPTAKMRHQAEALAKVGVPHHNIANMLHICTQTLLKHYREELDSGASVGLYAVCKSLLAQCKKGNVKAQIFYLQCRAGWRITQVVQQQQLGADGEPVAPLEAKDPLDAMRSYLEFLAQG